MRDRIHRAYGQIRADQALLDRTAAALRRELQAGERGRKKSGPVWGRLAVAAACVLAVCGAGLLSARMLLAPDAYVSIDVNPSIELTLNRMDRVIATHAFNTEGEEVLASRSLVGKRSGEAVQVVLEQVEERGYLAGDGLVAVTVQAGEAKEQTLLQTLWSATGQSLSSEAEVEVFPVSAETHAHAHDSGVSPAKYLALQELLEVDGEATFEAYAHHSIGQIRQRTRECMGHGAENGGGHGNRGGYHRRED